MGWSVVFIIILIIVYVYCSIYKPEMVGGKKVVKLIASTYIKSNQRGDFLWMIKRSEYDNALFIFNDNETKVGTGGSAQIRGYTNAVGIPTGTQPGPGNGYNSLTSHAKNKINIALSEVKSKLITGKYNRVYYSASNGKLGSGIYGASLGEDVKEFIVSELKSVVKMK